ncbi:MAG: AAA family ATPase, partial [Candidatus Portnoybacteria bacterium]|nr:AAA family ATPase [Candidatus Portnoybacteria bacterium]
MIIGHQRVLKFLKKSIEHERLSHAYLFSGPAHLGKKAVASEFVKMLTGIEISETVHPDILIIEPQIIEKEGVQKEMEIGIPQIREAQRRISLFACQSSHKIAIINQADRMTREASNCLLKTLEEPTGGTVLILITSSFQSLLPTIVSRCQLINFLPVAIEYCKNPKLLEEQNEAIADLEKLLRANFNERCQYAEKAAKNTPEARRNLGYWTIWFRDLLLSAAGCADLSLYP